MVDLTAQPFNLDAEGVQWVKDTIAGMTDEEKIGQLFVNMGSSRDEDYLTDMVSRYHIGAVRYQPGPAVEIWEQNRILQEKSKIPMLIAANTEAGGNGACTDGTYVGWEVKIAATREPRYAYELGRISGVEAAAIGCNWSFAPIVDLYRNWRNPIISQRTWSADVEQTKQARFLARPLKSQVRVEFDSERIHWKTLTPVASTLLVDREGLHVQGSGAQGAGEDYVQGAKGVDADQFKRAAQLGVTKINIDTDGRLVWCRVHRESFRDSPENFDLRPPGKIFMKEYAKFIVGKNEKLGSAGQVDEVRTLIKK